MMHPRNVSWTGCAVCAMAVLCMTLDSAAPAAPIEVTHTVTHNGHTVAMDFVTVGDPGNAAGTNGFGAVGYEYDFGKYNVTSAQYAAFLNAVASDGNYGLWERGSWASHPSDSMATLGTGPHIQRSGDEGNYMYSVTPGFENRPVNIVSKLDAIRFANWMTTGDIDSGVYTYMGSAADPVFAVDRTFATLTGYAFALPNDDEWYKAGYYDPTKDGSGGYWRKPFGGVLNDSISTDMANYGNAYGGPTDVDLFDAYPSYYGAIDMAGNLREWNEAVGWTAVNRSVLWSDTWYQGSNWLNDPTRHETHFITQFHAYGFRLAMVPTALIPEPGSIAMLFGAVGLLLWRRRRRNG